MFILGEKTAFTALLICAITAQLNAIPEKSCPVTAVTGTTEEIIGVRRSTISSILDTSGLKPSAAWKKFRSILQEMNNGNDQNQMQVVGLAMMTLSSYLPYLDQKPNGCLVAKLINGTVSCQRDHVSQPLHLAFKDMRLLLTQLLKQMELNAVSVSGCQGSGKQTLQSPFTEPPVAVCYDDGFSYELEAIWQENSSFMPTSLQKVVQEMYAGQNHLDRMSALLMTYALLPSVRKVYGHWTATEAIEIINLQYGDSIPDHCCSARLANIRALQDSSNGQKDPFIQPEIDFYSSPTACSA